MPHVALSLDRPWIGTWGMHVLDGMSYVVVALALDRLLVRVDLSIPSVLFLVFEPGNSGHVILIAHVVKGFFPPFPYLVTHELL